MISTHHLLIFQCGIIHSLYSIVVLVYYFSIDADKEYWMCIDVVIAPHFECVKKKVSVKNFRRSSQAKVELLIF